DDRRVGGRHHRVVPPAGRCLAEPARRHRPAALPRRVRADARRHEAGDARPRPDPRRRGAAAERRRRRGEAPGHRSRAVHHRAARRPHGRSRRPPCRRPDGSRHNGRRAGSGQRAAQRPL
ncbi:MAG: Na(+) H(+) antiporter subunit G, partial [uncultured Acidimicrobiales bacterium]